MSAINAMCLPVSIQTIYFWGRRKTIYETWQRRGVTENMPPNARIALKGMNTQNPIREFAHRAGENAKSAHLRKTADGWRVMQYKTFIIAEVGVNHDGRWERGLDLIDAAKAAGADAVKFQMFNSQRLWGDDRIKHLELSEKEMLAMHAHCEEIGIEFCCTPFGVPEVEFLTPLVKRWKIASGCLTRWNLLNAIRETGLPAILSTGMADIPRIAAALNVLGGATLLHCTSAYPCPTHEANLSVMDTLRVRFGKPVGYSDHTDGILVALAAVARGATVLEKHLTLDRNAEGPDHKASIEPMEFRIMVNGIRIIEQAIGSPEKRAQLSEAATMKAW